MRRRCLNMPYLPALVPALTATLLAASGWATPTSEPEQVIAIGNAAGVKAEIFDGACAFVSAHLRAPLRTFTSPEVPGTSFMEKAKAAAALKKTNDVCLVILVNLEDVPDHCEVSTGRDVAVINVAALNGNGAHKLQWRIERLIMRAVAIWAGVPPAPDRHCATHPYESIEDLDAIGRSFCPPSFILYERGAQKLGLHLKPGGALP